MKTKFNAEPVNGAVAATDLNLMWQLDQHAKPTGWLLPQAEVRCLPSLNFSPRPAEMAIELVVVHAISLPAGCFESTTAIGDLFCNCLDVSAHPDFSSLDGVEVSAHFLIDRVGSLTQFVSTFDRAWHAGVSSWRGRERCNDFSIGIELVGSDDAPFTSAQYRTLQQLIAALHRQHHDLIDIVGHCHIASGRKTDPGAHFDWSKLEHLRAQMSVSHQI